MEVKSVTAVSKEHDAAIFPDTKTSRGVKHIETLIELKDKGYNAILFFCVQRNGVTQMRTAPEFDREYAYALELAMKKGVDVIAYSCHISLEGITLDHSIPIVV